MSKAREETMNVAEAKKRLSTLLGRVAFGKETILIMRRGRPIARLVPADDDPVEPGLGTVRGWLSDDDPFLAAVEEIVTARGRHRPRSLRKSRVQGIIARLAAESECSSRALDMAAIRRIAELLQ